MPMVLETGILLASPSPSVADLPPPSPAVVDGGPEGEAEEASAKSVPSTPSFVFRDFDRDFYFGGVLVTFQAEDHFFRVPTYMFAKESSYFTALFKLPVGDIEGVPPTVALPVDVRWEDFRNVLKALYPTSVETTLLLSESEWISVLKLSTKWHFYHLRKVAISQLESLPTLTALSKVVLGHQCSISSWFLSGFTDIVKREATISNDDVAVLDYVTAIELFRLREAIRPMPKSRNGYDDESAINTMIQEGLYSAFADELLSIKAEENSMYPRPTVGIRKGKGPRRET